MVDGLGTGNVQEVVIRDRQMLAQDGMFNLDRHYRHEYRQGS